MPRTSVARPSGAPASTAAATATAESPRGAAAAMRPDAVMPRTGEVLWDGASSLPFTLKRKRTGAILVTKLKRADVPLRIGSELRLVGGFPVQYLTLGEVKKVMLHAPKPVSLVFLNHDDVVLDNSSFLSEERGSFETDDAAHTEEPSPSHSQLEEQAQAADATTVCSSSDDEMPSCGSRRRRAVDADQPTPKVSKLKLTLDRMNELLNRPVRRSALNVAAGKCIVV